MRTAASPWLGREQPGRRRAARRRVRDSASSRCGAWSCSAARVCRARDRRSAAPRAPPTRRRRSPRPRGPRRGRRGSSRRRCRGPAARPRSAGLSARRETPASSRTATAETDVPSRPRDAPGDGRPRRARCAGTASPCRRMLIQSRSLALWRASRLRIPPPPPIDDPCGSSWSIRRLRHGRRRAPVRADRGRAHATRPRGPDGVRHRGRRGGARGAPRRADGAAVRRAAGRHALRPGPRRCAAS